MKTKLKINVDLNTGGNGCWSRQSRTVHCTKLELAYFDATYKLGELRVYFTKRSWNVSKHGLIYTDKQWINELRQYLIVNVGFSAKSVNGPVHGIYYSEQGMQGNNYVSLDFGKNFISEWKRIVQ